MRNEMSLADEKDIDFDEWVNGAAAAYARGLGECPNESCNAPSADKPRNVHDEEEDEEEESSDEDSSRHHDGLDWEDAAEDDETDALDRKMPAKAVQIDLGSVPMGEKTTAIDESKHQRKRKRRNKLSNRFLPSEMREFLLHLSQAHLLCLTSALVSSSKSCTDDDAIAIIASLVPNQFISLTSHPTVDNLREFTSWLFPFLNDGAKTRNRRLRRNRSQGAPAVRRQRTQPSQVTTSPLVPCSGSDSPLISYAKHLANQYDDNPQLLGKPESEFNFWPNHKALLSLAMAHSFQWRTRLVQVLEPIRPVLDVDHPMLQSCADLFHRQSAARKRKPGVELVPAATPASTDMIWIEVLCIDPTAKARFRWVPIDPIRKLFDSPNETSRSLQTPLSYVVGVEHIPDSGRLIICDVTPRYTNSWIAVLKLRGLNVGKKSSVDERKTWWARTIRKINNNQRCGKSGTTADEAADDLSHETLAAAETEMENAEREELNKRTEQESIPTSKAAFQTHPFYVIPSVLGKAEVLAPDASKRVCGVFKGQLIYKRSDVSTALIPKKWLYQGRKVKTAELGRPIKEVNVRKKPSSKSFKALKSYGVGKENDGSEQKRIRDLENGSSPLSDGVESLYAVWQTEKWSPSPVGPHDKIPINEYKNVELALLNPGLVHIDRPGLAAIAKKLGIPYAPCLLGFEGHGGNRTPIIRGIVVHKHNEILIREAAVEWQNHADGINDEKRHKTMLSRWKRLMVGLLTKDRLDSEYGGKGDDEVK